MKLLWVSHSSGVRGAELCLVEAVGALQELKVESMVALPAHGALSDILQKMNVPIAVLPLNWWTGKQVPVHLRVRRSMAHLGNALRLSKLLDQFKPDLVLTNTLAIPAGALAAKWRGIPHIWFVHEFGRDDHGLRFDFGENLSFLLMGKLSERIAVNSKAVCQKLERWIPASQLCLIYYSVDISHEPKSPDLREPHFNLVLIGYKAPEKRQEDALRALAILIGKGLDVRLSLVGSEEPEYGNYLRRLASDLNIEDAVSMMDFTEIPGSHIVGADVALMCSVQEAFGRVTIEAMKLGRPVIGTDTGGTVEIIRDGVNGLLYSAGDPEELARKIELLYHDRSLLMAMGQRAKEFSLDRFNKNNYRTDLLNLFDSVIRSGGGESDDPGGPTKC